MFMCNKGIDLHGMNILVEENIIERLYRGTNGGDADNFRFFGENIVIRSNIMYGTLESEIGVSHVDLFQTYDADGGYAHNVLIEKNIGIDFYHQGVMFESNEDSHSNIFFYKNIFINPNSFAYCIEGGKNIQIQNNIIFNGALHGIAFRLNGGTVAPSGTIKNNIFVYTKAPYWKEEGAIVINGYNLIYKCGTDGNAIPGIESETDILFTDPMFNIGEKRYDVTLDDVLGPDGTAFTDDDGLNIKDGSPVLHAGENGVNIGPY